MLRNRLPLRHHVGNAWKGKTSPRTFDELIVKYQKTIFLLSLCSNLKRPKVYSFILFKEVENNLNTDNTWPKECQLK